jgi:hypothetical protein
MFKKIYFSIALSCLSMTALGASITELNDQLTHIKAQIKKVVLSWQRAELTLKQAQKLNVVIYHEAQSDIKDILAREEIITKMDELSDDRKTYKAINFLAVYFPTLLPKIEPPVNNKLYLYSVVAALANKAFRSLLLKQLMSKERKLMIAIKKATEDNESQLL